jgi:transcriptional regulator with XRE-family HTH domain
MPGPLRLPVPLLLDSLARVIRRLREETGYSQERFAGIIGVHRTYMGHLERGTANPTLWTLDLVAGGLGISVAELLALATREARMAPTATPTVPVRRVAEPGTGKRRK